MLDVASHDDLSIFLQNCVNSIREQFPRFSANQLSKRLGIPNSTFDRISKGEVKNPSFVYAMKIVQEARGESSAQEFIDKFYPCMSNQMEKIYPGNSKANFARPEVETYLQDSTSFELMMMIVSKVGVTRELVAQEFGKRGLVALERMVESGLVEQNGDTLIISETLNLTQETVQKLVQNLIGHSYDLYRFGTQSNWLSVQWETVDREKVLPLLMDVCRRANSEIRTILQNPANVGGDLVWTSIGMDHFNKALTSEVIQ